MLGNLGLFYSPPPTCVQLRIDCGERGERRAEVPYRKCARANASEFWSFQPPPPPACVQLGIDCGGEREVREGPKRDVRGGIGFSPPVAVMAFRPLPSPPSQPSLCVSLLLFSLTDFHLSQSPPPASSIDGFPMRRIRVVKRYVWRYVRQYELELCRHEDKGSDLCSPSGILID